MLIDGVVELDDHQFEPSDHWTQTLAPAISLSQLEYQSLRGNVEAQLDLCVAASVLCGGDYADITDVDDWGRALADLRALHMEMRADERGSIDLIHVGQAWERADALFAERFSAALRSVERSWADQPECETMTTATKATKTSAKRSRAKSAVPEAVNQIVTLRIEPRLKWTGSIDLVPIAGGGGRTVHVTARDSKLKLDLDWRGSQASESAALIEAFTVIEDWVEQRRSLSVGPDRARLQSVIEQLRAHRKQLIVEGVPETEAQAAEKEAAVDEFAAAECNRDGTAWSLPEWTMRLKDVVDVEAWSRLVGKVDADEALSGWYHEGMSIVDAAREIDVDLDSDIDGEMDLRDDEKPTEGSYLQEVPLEQIQPSPLNPRTSFDEASLADLSASIKTVGLLQPIVVYCPQPSTLNSQPAYELIAGERRYRAAKLAGLTAVPCIVMNVSTEQAIELRVVENLKREDLNAIDEARGFVQMLERCGYSQRTLAERLGVSQGHIGNRVGLLKLPEVWINRVITGEITATMARELIPWAADAAILEDLDEGFQAEPDVMQEEWTEQVEMAVKKHSRPMTGQVSKDGKGWPYVKIGLSKKDLAREDLDVREVRITSYGRSEKEKRAFNVALWDDLHRAGLDRRQAAEQKKLEQVDEKAAAKVKSGQLSPEAAKKKAEQQREQWTKKLSRYKIRWLQEAIVAKLQAMPASLKKEQLLLKLVLHFALVDEDGDRWRTLKDHITAANGKLKSYAGQDWRYDPWATLSTIPLDRCGSLAWGLVLEWIAGPVEGYHADFKPADIEALATELGIDFVDEWYVDRSFLELCPKAKLQEYCMEWKITVTDGKRGEMIDELLEQLRGKTGKAPKELAKLAGIRL